MVYCRDVCVTGVAHSIVGVFGVGGNASTGGAAGGVGGAEQGRVE